MHSQQHSPEYTQKPVQAVFSSNVSEYISTKVDGTTLI